MRRSIFKLISADNPLIDIPRPHFRGARGRQKYWESCLGWPVASLYLQLLERP